jgi:DNA replication licensing factor MCM7
VQAMRAGLVANVYLECMQVKQHKKKYSEHVMTDEMKERLLDYSTDREIYSKLARSLAPEIFGFEDVKKAIMLLMVRASCRVIRGS